MGASKKATHSFPFPEIIQFGGELIVRGLTKKQFGKISASYPEFRMERNKNGDITVMAPVKGGTGIRENKINRRLGNWAENMDNGQVFSPSTGFDLPDGATKSPDVAWVSKEKMVKLSPKQIEEDYIPVVPDFIIEVRSKSDRLKNLQDKMLNTTALLALLLTATRPPEKPAG